MLGQSVAGSAASHASQLRPSSTGPKSRPQTSASMRSGGANPRQIIDWLGEELEYTLSLRDLSDKTFNESDLKPLCSATNKEFMSFLVDRVKQARHVAAFREYMSIDKNVGSRREGHVISSGDLFTMKQLSSERSELQRQLDEYRNLCQIESAKQQHLLEKHSHAVKQFDSIKEASILAQRDLVIKRSLLQKQTKYLEQLKLLQSKLSIHASHSSTANSVHSVQSGKLSIGDTMKIIVKLLDDCQTIDDIKRETENIDWSSVQVSTIRQFIEKSFVNLNIEIKSIHDQIVKDNTREETDIFNQPSNTSASSGKIESHLHRLRRKFVKDHELLSTFTSDNHKLEASSKANLHRLSLLIRSKHSGDAGPKICAYFEALVKKESSRALVEHIRKELHNLTIMKHDFLAQNKNLSRAVEASKQEQNEIESRLLEKSDAIKKLISVQHVMGRLSKENLNSISTSTEKIEMTVKSISELVATSKDLLSQNLNIFNTCFTFRFGSCKLSDGTESFISDLSINKRSVFDGVIKTHHSIDSVFLHFFDSKLLEFYEKWIKEKYDSAKVQFDADMKTVLSAVSKSLGRDDFKSVRLLINWLRESNSMCNQRFANEELEKLQDIMDAIQDSEAVIRDIQTLRESSNDIFNILQFAQTS